MKALEECALTVCICEAVSCPLVSALSVALGTFICTSALIDSTKVLTRICTEKHFKWTAEGQREEERSNQHTLLNITLYYL